MVFSRSKLRGIILEHEDDDTYHGSSSFMPSLPTVKRLRPYLPSRNSLRPSFSRQDEGPHGFMPDTSHVIKPDTYISINPFEEGQLGTIGLDLRVGRLIAWSDVVADNVTYANLGEMKHKTLKLGEKFVLEPDENGEKVYYITSFEEVKFSNNLEMAVDSKSTTGRVGGMSHGAGKTSHGNLITIVQPYAFPLMVECGKTKLSQAIFRYKGTPYMTNEEILKSGEINFKGRDISLEKSLTPKGLSMQFDTSIAYRAKKCDNPIEMDAKGTVDWRDYFELIDRNSSLTLDRRTLYLLGSLGNIELGRACGILSREEEVLTGTGTWGHFAGIFQPGFQGGITMEVYSHSKRKISRGDKAGVVLFDAVETNANYGNLSYQKIGSYQGQKTPTLPKMFNV